MPNMLVKISDDPRKFMNFSILWEKKKLRNFFLKNIIPPIRKTQKFRLVLPKWTNFKNCKWSKNRVCNCFLVLKYTKKTWFHEFSYCLRDFVKILTKSFFYHSAYWASAFLTIWTSRRSMCWSCIIWFHEKKLYSDPNLNSPQFFTKWKLKKGLVRFWTLYGKYQ